MSTLYLPRGTEASVAPREDPPVWQAAAGRATPHPPTKAEATPAPASELEDGAPAGLGSDTNDSHYDF